MSGDINGFHHEEKADWDLGLQRLIDEAVRLEDQAQEEIRYLAKLREFVEVGKQYREAFRLFAINGLNARPLPNYTTPPPLPEWEDEAPPVKSPIRLKGEQIASHIFGQMRDLVE